jgi:hypothetical protein
MPGVPLGIRALINLTRAVTAQAGSAEALLSLVVLLHLKETQVEQALLQLCSFNFCGCVCGGGRGTRRAKGDGLRWRLVEE